MKNFFAGILLLLSFSLSAQTLQEYYFDNNLTGTNGGGVLTELVSCGAAPGAFGLDTIRTSNGICSISNDFCFNKGGGFSYPNNGITGTYTINLLCKFKRLRGYTRVIDFSNSTRDIGIYLYDNCMNFFPNGIVGPCPNFATNVFYLFTFVRDSSTNVISIFVNGAQFATYVDVTNVYKSPTPTTPIHFFRDDNAAPCEVNAGCIKYASLSPQKLSPTQVDSVWYNICDISLTPCTASIAYPGSPFRDTLTSAQPAVLTGRSGGIYSSTSGLAIDSITGAITPASSIPGTYTVTYSVAAPHICSRVNATATVVITPSSYVCDPTGNMIVFANYNGGILNINIDQNIPNLKIGVCSYEPVTVNLTGPYAANVTKVIRAGFPNTNNNTCNSGVFTSSINGPTPANYSVINMPPVSLSNPNGYAAGIICATTCNTTSNQGGCNTIDQVVDYFSTQFGGTLYSLKTQYCCWQSNAPYYVSALMSSCCSISTPSATISYSNSSYCQSEFSAQPVSRNGSTGGTYSASPAGLSINAVTGEIIPATSTAGSYTVTYTVPGCPVFTTTAAVNITTVLGASITYPASEFCPGEPVQQVTQTGTLGGVYSTTPGGMAIDAATGDINPSASAPGNYVVNYTLAPSGSCPAFVAKDTIKISTPVTTNFSATICAGSTYTFDSHTFDTTVTYIKTLTAVSGCDSLIVFNLTVVDLPVPALTVSDSLICSGDSARISAAANLGYYRWNTEETGYFIYAKNTGNYYVTVTDVNNCSVRSNATAIAVHPSPSVSVIVNGNILRSLKGTTQQWYLNGSAIDGATDSVFIAYTSGGYQVEITDEYACKSMSAMFEVASTDIPEIQAEDLQVYPNPIENGLLHFETGLDWLGAELAIYNYSGQLIFKTSVTTQRFEIDLNAPQGAYYLHVNTRDNSLVKKLIHL